MVLVAAALAGCGDAADAVCREGVVSVGGHSLRLGEPLEQWQAALGPGRDDRGNVIWSEHGFLVHIERSACGERRVMGVRFTYEPHPDSDDPRYGGAVQLEDCRFAPGQVLGPRAYDCGTCEMVAGHPFAHIYRCSYEGLWLDAMIQPGGELSFVSYMLSDDNLGRLGLRLGYAGGDEFVASGACERERHALFGDEWWGEQKEDLLELFEKAFRAVARWFS